MAIADRLNARVDGAVDLLSIVMIESSGATWHRVERHSTGLLVLFDGLDALMRLGQTIVNTTLTVAARFMQPTVGMNTTCLHQARTDLSSVPSSGPKNIKSLFGMREFRQRCRAADQLDGNRRTTQRDNLLQIFDADQRNLLAHLFWYR